MPNEILSPPTTEFLDVDDDTEAATLSPLAKKVAAMGKRARSAKTAETAALAPTATQIADMRQLDLFVADLLDYNLKDDMATMEAPLFSLSTKPDMETWRWTSSDKKKWLEVTPSSKGRATIHDKDLLIYITSQLMAAMNEAQRTDKKMPGRRVRFIVYDFLVATKRDTSGRAYELFESMVDRLSGTRLKTNIEMGNLDRRSSFGLIERADYIIATDGKGNKRMTSVEVTISEWLYRTLELKQVLTINDEYFSLRKPLEKRLYELARKHVGNQSDWTISEQLLFEKTGSTSNIREFRRMLKAIIADDCTPDYRIAYCEGDSAKVRMYQKDAMKFALGLAKKTKAATAVAAAARGVRKPKPFTG